MLSKLENRKIEMMRDANFYSHIAEAMGLELAEDFIIKFGDTSHFIENKEGKPEKFFFTSCGLESSKSMEENALILYHLLMGGMYFPVKLNELKNYEKGITIDD